MQSSSDELGTKAGGAQHKVKRSKYYIKGNIVRFEEDALHEFKGHFYISAEEVPAWSYLDNGKTTMKAVSKAINGFLNTGNGGTVYLGITDNGEVKGLHLNQYKKDHINTSLSDTMMRYNPPVEEHRYRLRFIPVIDPNDSEEIKQKTLTFDSSKGITEESRQREHILRSSMDCWCDRAIRAETQAGTVPMSYIAEVYVKPWDPSDPRNQGLICTNTPIHPVHEDEEGNVYFRKQASVTSASTQDIVNITRHDVRTYYKPQIAKLKAELARLKEQA